jgi:transposase
MLLIGVDYHPSFQQVAFLNLDTGECGELPLNHSDGEAERFYRDLQNRGIRVRVGMEATGYSRWFERLLAELDFELWIGDPAEIKTRRVKKQKTDRKDAQLLLRLMREDNFPRIWVPSPENRDVRQLLWHRHRLVQMRTRIMNQLQALAMNEGRRWKAKLWSEQGRAELEKLALAPWASRRRKELRVYTDRFITDQLRQCGFVLAQTISRRIRRKNTPVVIDRNGAGEGPKRTITIRREFVLIYRR